MAPSIVALSCPNCGANLDAKPGAEQITCPFCCKTVMVSWGDQTPSREPTGQDANHARIMAQVEQAPGAAQPAQRPEVGQDNLRVREKIADHALLQQLERERIAAEAVVAEESLELGRLRDALGHNQLYRFVAIGCSLLTAILAATIICGGLSQGLEGKSSLSETISSVLSCMFMAGIVLAVLLFLQWVMGSASRRQSAQVHSHEQEVRAALTELERLKQQEAQVRGRLVE